MPDGAFGVRPRGMLCGAAPEVVDAGVRQLLGELRMHSGSFPAWDRFT
jgi:hypothetical protein